MACVKGLEEILRRRLKNLSEKNEAKDSGRDVLGIVDGGEVVCVRSSKEFMFFHRRGIEMMTGYARHLIVF